MQGVVFTGDRTLDLTSFPDLAAKVRDVLDRT